MRMSLRTSKKLVYILTFIVLALAVPSVYALYAKSSNRFGDWDWSHHKEPQKIIEVPQSWGQAVSISYRPASIAILFESGNIIVVTGYFPRSIYAIKILYVEGV